MRAQLLSSSSPSESSPLQSADLPIPQPGRGQILIRVSACGVCHTDLHTVEGELIPPHPPIVPGHQVVGTVAGLGSGVEGWSVGDRAGAFWLYRSCGRCAFCAHGEENLCPEAEFTGLHRNGGYAEYMLAEADYALRIPASFRDAEAAPLLCAGIIGYRSLRKAEVQPGEAVGLFGFGASAHLALQAARHWDCRVFVFTRSESHRPAPWERSGSAARKTNRPRRLTGR
jgi:propanol-preferring alcohol dehydrogenase